MEKNTNRTGLRVDKGGRDCSICHVYKPWDSFWVDKKAATGHNTACFECKRKRGKDLRSGDGKPLRRRMRKQLNPALIKPEEDIDLQALLGVKRTSKNSWSFQQAKTLFEGVVSEWQSGNTNINAEEIAQKYGNGKSKGNCVSLIAELKRAAKEGMKLAEYWNKGRPFSAYAKNNEVIVPGKKKKKK